MTYRIATLRLAHEGREDAAINLFHEAVRAGVLRPVFSEDGCVDLHAQLVDLRAPGCMNWIDTEVATRDAVASRPAPKASKLPRRELYAGGAGRHTHIPIACCHPTVAAKGLFFRIARTNAAKRSDGINCKFLSLFKARHFGGGRGGGLDPRCLRSLF